MSIRPITDTLRILQGGLFLDQCSDKLAAIVKGVEETGKAGKLTITLDVKKAAGAVSVLAKVSDKTPEEAPDADLFYATTEGNLSVDNPSQRKLDLRSVEPQKQALREIIDPDTGVISSAA